jgi:hypothetical protein
MPMTARILAAIMLLLATSTVTTQVAMAFPPNPCSEIDFFDGE